MIKYDKVNKKIRKLLNENEILKSKCDELTKKNLKINTVLQSTMHEVRRFSGELSYFAEELSKSTSQKGQNHTKELAETIFYTSGLLTARLGFTDIELNPNSIKNQIPLRTGIYKKFEKARYVLWNKAKTKNIDISFKGNSYLEIDAIQAFELVPFVILENSIKYSPKEQKINIIFEEIDKRELDVTINNIGPLIQEKELSNLFDRAFRGINAEKSLIPGEGLGLYLAKSLCELSKVDIDINSNETTTFNMNGIPYSEFNLTLKFRNH